MPDRLDDKAARAKVRRSERFAARHTLWDESKLSRVRSCGRAPQRNSIGVQVKCSEGHAGYGNLQSCGSVWACPVCSAKIASVRQGDIAAALGAWYQGADQDGGYGKIALVTLTMRHHKGQSLAALWGALSESWHAVASARGWASDQLEHGTIKYGDVYKIGKRKGQPRVAGSIPVIRVVEVTTGDKGWHVHVHALLFLPSSASDESVARLGMSMWGRWVAALNARGLGCDLEHGVDARLLHGNPAAALGEYFAKAVYSASMEVARSDMKSANHGNRTPFAVLAAVVKVGDADDLDTWAEYERGSKGRRQITWSHGLRALLLPAAPVVELTDQEIADADQGGDVVAEVGRDLWALIVARRADLRVLRAFERGFQHGCRLLWDLADQAALEEADKWAAMCGSKDGVLRRLQGRD